MHVHVRRACVLQIIDLIFPSLQFLHQFSQQLKNILSESIKSHQILKYFFPLKHIKIINSQIIIKKRLLKSTCYGVFPFPKWCHICWNICFDLKVDNCRFNFFASKDGNRVAHKLANHAFPLESSCLDWYCSLLAFLYCEGWDGIYWYFWCIGLIVCLS